MGSIAARIFSLGFLCTIGFGQNPQLTVASPDGNIEFSLIEETSARAVPSRLSFQIRYRGSMLVNPSPLAIRIFSEAPVLGENLRLVSSKKASVNEGFAIPMLDGRGRNRYNGLIAEFAEDSGLGRSLAIEVRIFDDGAAFRYGFPKRAIDDPIFIEDEETEFRFAGDGSLSPAPQRPGVADAPMPGLMSAIQLSTQLRMPVRLNLTGLPLMTLSEANASWAHLNRAGVGPNLIFRLPSICGPCSDGPVVDPRKKIELKLPARTPWRALAIDSGPVKQTETMLLNLGRASISER